MKKSLLFSIAIICIITFAAVYLFLLRERNERGPDVKTESTKLFSIGNKSYFEIPVSKIKKYPLSEGETLFGETTKTNVSIIDIFKLTPTVIHCLNEELLQKREVAHHSDQQIYANVLNGPFYIYLNDSNNTLNLEIDGVLCYQIDFEIASGELSESFSDDIDSLILGDNTFNSTVINDAERFCLSPLVFMQDPIKRTMESSISIVPETMIEEVLFSSAKDAKCILRINNSDFGLLVSVLRAYTSYLGSQPDSMGKM